VLGVVAVSLIPWSAAAAETTPPTRSPSLRTALTDVRPKQVAPPRPSPAVTRRTEQATSNPAAESPTFFKTRTGIVVAAVMAAGAGYAIYSTSHDRIHSAGKQ